MASVLLPTNEWTESCADLARQLKSEDELLVLCDSPDSSVARDPLNVPSTITIEVIPVGDPIACSGKAHALAVGLERATQDLIVLTDDDVEREREWLETLRGLAREHGAASATPVFVGGSTWWHLLEPTITTLGSALICLYGGVWGGGVAFERDNLNESRYCRDLERTVSDDALLLDHLDRVYTTSEVVNTVRVPLNDTTVRDRITRFVLTYRYWLPRATAGLWVLSLAFLVLSVVAPLLAFGGVTVGALAAYRYLGIHRWTWLLAFPSALVIPVVLASAWLYPVFEWGDRRYRWTDRYDVTIEPVD